MNTDVADSSQNKKRSNREAAKSQLELETEGFEPSIGFARLRFFKPLPSTTRPRLRQNNTTTSNN